MKISFHLHVNKNSFSYERISTRTHFEKEAKRNSEMRREEQNREEGEMVQKKLGGGRNRGEKYGGGRKRKVGSRENRNGWTWMRK